MFTSDEPFDAGMLPLGDGNEMYWETSGSPSGKPALYVHGGPGSGMQGGYRQHFDPEKFFIIGFDQRGCGRSRPLATDPEADLAANTTQALIGDMEVLREHLGVGQWLLYGGSWGTTLSLAYAQAHPERVSELILAAVTTTSAAEVSWITEDMGRVFPREWDEFFAAAEPAPGERIIDAYYRLLTGPDASVRERAALAWCTWEDVHMSLDPKATPHLQHQPPEFRLLFATLVTHYWRNAGFGGDSLLGGMDRIGSIPGVLIHGRLDVSSPLSTAWNLARAWPAAELVVIEQDGHGGRGMADEVTRAVARFAPASG